MVKANDVLYDNDSYITNSDPTQCQQIADYIAEHGSITAKEAEDLFGCMRLASRIAELRKKYHIVTKMEKGKNRLGKTTHYARYSFAEEK